MSVSFLRENRTDLTIFMEGGGGYKDKITWALRIERGNGNGQSHVLRGHFSQCTLNLID